MSKIGLPDPLGLFGERTGLMGQDLTSSQMLSGVSSESTAALLSEKPTMPIPDDQDVQKRRRRSYAQQRTRTGRASTIFTEGEGLGG